MAADLAVAVAEGPSGLQGVVEVRQIEVICVKSSQCCIFCFRWLSLHVGAAEIWPGSRARVQAGGEKRFDLYLIFFSCFHVS